MDKDLLNIVLNIAVKAGEKIMEIYQHTDFNIEIKSDNSPLTSADLSAHKIIVDCLEKTQYPVLSEESDDKSWEIRKNWDCFWLVDPLDGTKEFIKRNGDFTVNIALIKHGVPVAGVIYVPVSKELYLGIVGQGAYKIMLDEDNNKSRDLYSEMIATTPINVSTDVKDCFVVAGSRSHRNEETDKYIHQLQNKYKNTKIISRGSSLKICMVAEGKAHIYPRYYPTMEWDTAAGHAIVMAAGGEIINCENGSDLVYNKENLRNPYFIVKPKGIEF